MLSNSNNSILTNIDLDIIFKNPNHKNILESLTESDIWKVLSKAIINSNFELVYYIVSQNMDINKKSILGEKILINILTTDIKDTIYNKLVIKIIEILVKDTDKYTENIVLIYAQNIGHINIELYKKIKILLNIPDLTYDNLLNYVDNHSIYGDGYVINEIILNHNLIHEINTKRNHKLHSLLYIVCKKRNLHVLRVLMKVNEYTDVKIDVNVKNDGSLSTPLHGLIYGEDPSTNDFNFTFKIPRMIDILIENGAKNIKNKNGELPVDNIRITKTDLIEKIKLLLSKISS